MCSIFYKLLLLIKLPPYKPSHFSYYWQGLRYYFELEALINVIRLSIWTTPLTMHLLHKHPAMCSYYRLRACRSLHLKTEATMRDVIILVFKHFDKLKYTLDIIYAQYWPMSITSILQKFYMSGIEGLAYPQPISFIVNDDSASLLDSIINKSHWGWWWCKANYLGKNCVKHHLWKRLVEPL